MSLENILVPNNLTIYAKTANFQNENVDNLTVTSTISANSVEAVNYYAGPSGTPLTNFSQSTVNLSVIYNGATYSTITANVQGINGFFRIFIPQIIITPSPAASSLLSLQFPTGSPYIPKDFTFALASVTDDGVISQGFMQSIANVGIAVGKGIYPQAGSGGNFSGTGPCGYYYTTIYEYL